MSDQILLSEEIEVYQRNNEFDKMKNNLENIKIKYCFTKNKDIVPFGSTFNNSLHNLPQTITTLTCGCGYNLQTILNMNKFNFHKYKINNEYVFVIKELWMNSSKNFIRALPLEIIIIICNYF
jgi:hypothetical protein